MARATTPTRSRRRPRGRECTSTVAGQGRGHQGRLRRGHPVAPDGNISECTGENIFVVRDGRLITPPSSDWGRSRASPRVGRDHRPTSGTRSSRTDHPDRSLHGRRGVPDRDGRRGGADPRRRRPHGRRRNRARSPRSCSRLFAAVHGEVDQYKTGWTMSSDGPTLADDPAPPARGPAWAHPPPRDGPEHIHPLTAGPGGPPGRTPRSGTTATDSPRVAGAGPDTGSDCPACPTAVDVFDTTLATAPSRRGSR